jgi:hypothetical protein
MMSEGEMDREEFDNRTRARWKRERLEVFKCAGCGLIHVGVPDCHKAMVNPEELSMTVGYNLPSPFKCGRCERLFPPGFLAPTTEVDYRVSVEEFRSSAWVWLLRPK